MARTDLRGGMRLRELEQECQIHVFVFALVLFWKKIF